MNKFLTSNDPLYRCLRTIVQGIIAAIVMYLPDLFGMTPLNPTVSALGVAVIMAILSPIMAVLGGELGARAADELSGAHAAVDDEDA